MTFVIYVPGRRENVGGHVVLHKFVQILSELESDVWTTEEPLFKCNAKVIEKNEEGEFDLSFLENKKQSDTVVLYPEQVEGNPFKIKNVSRWILYHTSKEIENTWNKGDVYFYFQPGFRTQRKDEELKRMTILDTKLSVCVNKGFGSKRSGYCHINKKKYPNGEKILESLNSTDLGDFMENGGFEYLVEELNKYEFFVTFDDATHYLVIAAMCGCRSVSLRPNVTISPDKYRELYPTRKYGVAFGWEDLKHADLTRDLVKDHMKTYENKSVQEVKSFISFWKNKLSNV